jgi:FSR family fosmidomycin resistance protein-like MFS transporter
MLADYWQGRWLGAISVAWTGLFYGLAAFAPDYPLMVTCLTIGALGSGAFHPVGMVNAAAAGGKYPTLATSIFFLLGQSGLAVGPMAGGLLLQYVDMRLGLPLLALCVAPSVVMMAVYLRHPLAVTAPLPTETNSHAAPTAVAQRRTSLVLSAFVILVALRAATLQSLTTLLPKYFADLGYESGTYGVMIGVFAFAAAFGTFAGGYLGDRINRRLTIFFAMLLSTPFTFLLLRVDGWLFYLTAACAGALLNVPHSILIIMAQRLLPKREGMIGGAVLGFMFASGAASAWVASLAADYIGLPLVLTLLAFVPIGAALSALLLPSTRPHPLPTVAASTPVAAD